MPTIPARVSGLSAVEARTIRNATSLCFDHDRDGNGYIRAITRGDDADHERTLTVPIESSRVQNYGAGDGPWDCFDMVMSAQYDDLAQTMLRRIRTGSRVAFVWTRDNASPVTRDAGLVVDMLDVKVHNGNVVDTFRVRTFVGLDNSARLIRKATA